VGRPPPLDDAPAGGVLPPGRPREGAGPALQPALRPQQHPGGRVADLLHRLHRGAQHGRHVRHAGTDPGPHCADEQGQARHPGGAGATVLLDRDPQLRDHPQHGQAKGSQRGQGHRRRVPRPQERHRHHLQVQHTQALAHLPGREQADMEGAGRQRWVAYTEKNS